ncbi:MAG: taurine dioxygenase, partial [Gammaproteobacteria bacterium]|nr:taurine dioxygenase [Gammaproteobacteria bacterium]
MSDIPDHWQVRRLAGALGAEVHGPDISNASPEDIEAIKSILLEHMVIFLPDQSPTAEAHISFGRHFGDLEGHPNLSSDTGLPPELFQLQASEGGVADEWHTDLTFQEQPALMSILHMVECPDTGGDTLWTSLYAAYDELSDPMKSMCDGLTALHDALPHNRPEDMTIHPVVRVHPLTGKKALYVNEHFTRRIVEMNSTESEMLLSYLTRWVSHPRFTVRYHWRPGTIGIWDNRCTQHFVLNDFEGERIIQRVTVVGDQVEGNGAPQWQ